MRGRTIVGRWWDSWEQKWRSTSLGKSGRHYPDSHSLISHLIPSVYPHLSSWPRLVFLYPPLLLVTVVWSVWSVFKFPSVLSVSTGLVELNHSIGMRSLCCNNPISQSWFRFRYRTSSQSTTSHIVHHKTIQKEMRSSISVQFHNQQWLAGTSK